MNAKTIVAIAVGLVLIIALAACDTSQESFNTSQKSQNINAEPIKKITEVTPPAPAPASVPVLKSEPEPDPLVCLDCHRSVNINTNEGVFASQAFCLDCHKEKSCTKRVEKTQVSLQVLEADFHQNQKNHKFIACINCHTDVARSPHKTLTGVTCKECHPLHGVAQAGDPHLRVACQACHFKSESVELAKNQVKLAHVDKAGKPIALTDHLLEDMEDEKTCEKCHYSDNQVGASAVVLPSKGAICILCHNTSLTMGSPLFGVASLIFLLGIFITLRFWFMGSVQKEEHSLHKKIALTSESIWQTIFSKQIFAILKLLILDIIFQRRILKENVSRWSMHSLIFSAILLRFFLALFTGVSFFVNPEGEWAMALMNKNSPFTAFAGDFLGLCILSGILWAVAQRYFFKPEHVKTEEQDNIALVIIGLLIVLGFLTEGVRILMTGIPGDTAIYAFVGYFISLILSIFGLEGTSIYPILWYAHGIVAALFVAYLPFGKMRHVFNTPLTYILEEVSGVKREERV